MYFTFQVVYNLSFTRVTEYWKLIVGVLKPCLDWWFRTNMLKHRQCTKWSSTAYWLMKVHHCPWQHPVLSSSAAGASSAAFEVQFLSDTRGHTLDTCSPFDAAEASLQFGVFVHVFFSYFHDFYLLRFLPHQHLCFTI